MDRRYREAKGTIDQGRRADRLIGSYLQQAARDNRQAAVMGGSTGGPDPSDAARRRGVISALRGKEYREGNAIFEDSRQQVRAQAGD